METYIIKKTSIDNVSIDSAEWENANVASICNATPNSQHSYNTSARMLYSEGGITVKMETDESPLRAVETKRNGDVYLDSCMEVFISPEGCAEYLNFEINPIGTLHLGLGDSRYDRKFPNIKTEIFDIHSIEKEGKWLLKFYIPFAVIDEIYGTHSKTFTGNIYKCGELTEYEHYLTWNKVDLPKADFHQPKFFGKFILE